MNKQSWQVKVKKLAQYNLQIMYLEILFEVAAIIFNNAISNIATYSEQVNIAC
jgi:hypothetical protein